MQLDLFGRQVDGCGVLALGDALLVADHHDRDVGVGSRLDRPLDRVGLRGRADRDGQPVEGDRALGRGRVELGDHLVGRAGDEIDLALDRHGEDAEETGAGRGSGRVADQLAVEEQPAGADAGDGEGPTTGRVGRERRGHAGGEVADGHPGCGLAEPRGRRSRAGSRVRMGSPPRSPRGEVVEHDAAVACRGRHQPAGDRRGAWQRPAGLERHRAGGGTVGDALQRGAHVGRGHLGAAAALELGLVGPPADHRDPRRGRRVERQDPVVGEEHDALGGGVACDASGLGRIGDGLPGTGRPARRRGPLDQLEHPSGGPGDVLVGDVAGLDRRGQVGAEDLGRARHLEVEPGAERVGAVGAEPVRHHHAVEPPLAPQQVGQQARGAGCSARRRRGCTRPSPTTRRRGARRPRTAGSRSRAGCARRPRRRSPCGRSPGRCSTKCLTEQATPWLWTPSMNATAISAGEVRDPPSSLEAPAAERVAVDVDGRGEQHAGALGREPPRPSSRPTRPISSRFQVEASAVPQGSDAEVDPVNWNPRAPLGPSVRPRPGTPRRSTPALCHMSAPAVRVACSSAVRSDAPGAAPVSGSHGARHDAVPKAARSAAPACAAATCASSNMPPVVKNPWSMPSYWVSVTGTPAARSFSA